MVAGMVAGGALPKRIAATNNRAKFDRIFPLKY
jgi:hypothetical protein